MPYFAPVDEQLASYKLQPVLSIRQKGILLPQATLPIHFAQDILCKVTGQLENIIPRVYLPAVHIMV